MIMVEYILCMRTHKGYDQAQNQGMLDSVVLMGKGRTV